MQQGDVIRQSLVSLRANKLRSLLTLLGVVIGIAAVITILTLGSALKVATKDSFASIGGTDFTAIIVNRDKTMDDSLYPKNSEGQSLGAQAAQPSVSVKREEDRFNETLLAEMEDKFGAEISGVSIVSSTFPESKITFNDRDRETTIMGVSDDYLKINGQHIISGRNITENDQSNYRNVAVIPRSMVDDLFLGVNSEALGAVVQARSSLAASSFVIVGIYDSEKNQDSGASGSQANVFIPYTTAGRLASEPPGVTALTIRPSEEANGEGLKKRVSSFLDSHFADNKDFRVEILDNKQMIESTNTLLGVISDVLAAIAGISLLVGGIGVMNIMLVSVSERSKEIGTRLAIGATKGNIRTQFMTEAIFICLIGGAVGVLLGSFVGIIGGFLLEVSVMPPIGGILIAFLFSILIGLFFGIYPANKAAGLNPIESLRND